MTQRFAVCSWRAFKSSSFTNNQPTSDHRHQCLYLSTDWSVFFLTLLRLWAISWSSVDTTTVLKDQTDKIGLHPSWTQWQHRNAVSKIWKQCAIWQGVASKREAKNMKATLPPGHERRQNSPPPQGAQPEIFLTYLQAMPVLKQA
jgi:hypothetical protein